MINEVLSILAPKTGYCHTLIRRMQDAGKENPEIKEARIQKIFEEERKRVQGIFNIKGEIIEYYKGRHLDVKA